MMSKSVLLTLACLALALVSADPKFTYPKCNTAGDASKCCVLYGDELLSHHSFFRAEINGASTVVTCKAGQLECHVGNPMLRATEEKYGAVACPDFKSLFESRSGLEILEGVIAAETTEDVTGQVKAADE